MWLRDLSLAWRPKSLSGLPLAMENCLRHFPSTFAPYESCIRHSPSLTKLFCFHAFFLFHLQATLRIVQPGAQTPARGILWGGQALGRSSSATSFPSHKLDGGRGAGVWCSGCAKRWPPLFRCCTLSRSTAAVEKPGDSHCGSTFAVVSAGAERQCVSCLRLRLVEYG